MDTTHTISIPAPKLGGRPLWFLALYPAGLLVEEPLVFASSDDGGLSWMGFDAVDDLPYFEEAPTEDGEPAAGLWLWTGEEVQVADLDAAALEELAVDEDATSVFVGRFRRPTVAELVACNLLGPAPVVPDAAPQPATEGVNCGSCWACYRASDEGDAASALVTFVVLCSACGNKRCPKATDHRYACTASNAPGQPGSIYGGNFANAVLE